MENENKKGMTNEEAEHKFKDAVFKAFASKMPGVHRDEDGFIVVPVRRNLRDGKKNE